MEEEARRKKGGAAPAAEQRLSSRSDGSDGITHRKVVDLMQLCMSRITQQDELIHSLSNHTAAVKHLLLGSTSVQAVQRSGPAKSLQKAKARQHREEMPEAEAAAEDVRLRLPLAARVSRLELELLHAEQQLAMQQHRAADSAAQADSSREETEALQQRLLVLQRQLAEASTRHKLEQAEAASLGQEAVDAKAAVQSCRQELADKLQELAVSSARVQELQDERRTMEQRLVQLEEQRLQQQRLLADELSAMRTDMKALETGQAQWAEREEKRQRQAEQSEAAIQQLQQELEERERLLSESRRSEAALMSEGAVLGESVTALQSRLFDSGRELEAAVDTAAQLQRTIVDLSAQSAAAQPPRSLPLSASAATLPPHLRSPAARCLRCCRR